MRVVAEVIALLVVASAVWLYGSARIHRYNLRRYGRDYEIPTANDLLTAFWPIAWVFVPAVWAWRRGVAEPKPKPESQSAPTIPAARVVKEERR